MSRVFEEHTGKYHGEAEYLYMNPATMFLELADPKDLYFIGGRAFGKTTNVFARRSLRVGKSMAGAYFAFVGDFYSNLLGNTVPTMIKGWNDLGLREGVDYAVNKEPPKHFAKPYKKPLSYKHTISLKNGCFFKLASMDVVTSLAGDSYQHVFGDEVKYLVKSKLDSLLPAKRGERLRYGGSPYYLGVTFTTDMPNLLAPNEYGWILEQEKNMDVEQIKLILQVAWEVNLIKRNMADAYLKKDRNEYDKQKRAYYRWLPRLYKVRSNSLLFYVVSSFATADVHGADWFENQLEILGIERFKSSILSMRQEIMQGEKFYNKLEPEHFYEDGLRADTFDSYEIGETPEITSRNLKYCNPDRKLEGGADWGMMMSLVIGQDQGKLQRILSNFFTLPKKNERDLAFLFCNFFRYHRYRVLDLYYDRSGNAWGSIGRDFASSFKDAVETMKIDGVEQNWKVNLMSEGQPTIYQQQEFILVNQMLSESNPRLPKVQIDSFQCMQLKSSLGLTKQIIKVNKEGSKSIHKDKSSEKNLSLGQLPMYSTNMSDALKYYLCRPTYMRLLKDDLESGIAYGPSLH